MAELISVIVPNRDGKEILPSCLEALAAQTYSDFETIVVDDSSEDGSAQMIKERYPESTLVELDKVHGFAGACVKGLEKSKGEWTAILNSDARPEINWLTEAMKAGRDNPAAGMVASAVYLPDGTVDSMGIGVDRFGMAYLRKHGQQAGKVQDAIEDYEEVFGPAGSAALYRRAMIDEAGFYEPSYFAYYEDLDMAFRARWRGWKCVLARNARVEHDHSYTATRVGVNKRALLQTNRLRTLVRNWPASWLAYYLPWLIAGELAGVARAFREANFAAPFLARKQFLRFLSSDVKTRKKVLGPKKEPPENMEHWLYHHDIGRKG